MTQQLDPTISFYARDITPPHPQQSVSIFQSASKLSPSSSWILYIHGGAWRDPREDKQMGYPLLEHVLPAHWSGASIDYRLSPTVQHPTHMDDVILAIQHLVTEYGMENMILVGHSAGACIALQILAELTALKLTSRMADDRQSNDDYLSDKIKAVVAVEGIYDLKDLVCEYPGYRDFVCMAFGADELEWEDASPSSFNWSQLKNGSGAKAYITSFSVQRRVMANGLV